MKRNQLVSISKGNRKLGGVMNISTFPRTCCPESVPCAREGCYTLKACRLYPATHKAWNRNERVAKRHPDSYFMQIAAGVAEVKPRLFRWHVAGDILSAGYLRGMCRIADANLCAAAGVPAVLFHDLRRTAARNLRAAGVPEDAKSPLRSSTRVVSVNHLITSIVESLARCARNQSSCRT